MGTLTMAVLTAGAAMGIWLVTLGVRGIPIIPDQSRRIPDAVTLNRSLGWLLAGFVTFLAVFAITGWPVAAIATGCAVAATPWWARRDNRAGHIERTEAIATWTEMIRDNMAGAAGLEQALVATSRLAPVAIRPEVRRFAVRLDDLPLADALAMLGDDLDHPSADLVVAALVNAARMESRDLGALLSRLAESIRGDVRMRLRVETGRARIRTSARMVIGVTIATIAFLFVFSRDLLDAYNSTGGQLWMVLVLIVFALAGYLLRAYGEIEMPERFSARSSALRQVPR